MDYTHATIRVFDSEIAANIAQGRLEAHGLDANLVDRSWTDGRSRHVEVALQVPLEEVDEALKILSQPEDTPLLEVDPATAALDGPPCPQCSERYAYIDRPYWFWPLAIVTLGLPALFVKPRWHCHRCDHWWDVPPSTGTVASPYRDSQTRR